MCRDWLASGRTLILTFKLNEMEPREDSELELGGWGRGLTQMFPESL